MSDIKPWKILLIDDDEDDYLLTRDMLSEANARTMSLTWVSCYEDGLRELTQNRSFDAVLLDYDLGAKNGLELLREVGGDSLLCPVILLTGRGSYAVDLEAMQSGVCLYLTKDEVNALLLERGIRYAVEMKQNERTLKNRAARLQLLSDLAAELLRSRDPVDLLDEVSRRLTELVEADVYVHYQVAADRSHLILAAIGGYPMEIRGQLQRLEFGQAVCGTVAKTGTPMVMQNVQQSREDITRLIRRLGITAYACHPLVVRGRLFGTLSFGSRARIFFDDETVRLLRTVCDLIALAFERREIDAAVVAVEAQKWAEQLQSQHSVNV